MKPFKKGLLAAAAFLLLSTGTACATADPEVQLDTIANAEPLWKDEFVARWDAGQMPQPHLLNYDRSQTRFAVTDLDGNGRLELLFRHAAVLRVHEGITPYPFRNIPTALAMTVYEIGTDGRLTRLPMMENGGAPNLTGLALHGIDSNNTRWYNVDTSILIEDEHHLYNYTVFYQRVALVNGVVRYDLLAEEKGYYNVYDIDRVEAVPSYANIYDGDPAHLNMRHDDFVKSAFYQDFSRIYIPANVIYWMGGDELKRNPREALAASWAGFVYGAIDGKG
jgi:lipoprotein